MSMLAMLGMLGAGAMSSAGAIYANQKNLDQQIANNNLSVDLSNTAHQREVLDLAKAGLNPILSATGSGASVPSLGVASQMNPGEGISEGVSSASNLVSSQYKAQVNNIKANTEQVDTINSALKADREVANLERKTDKLLAEARYDAARRLTGHEDHYEKGKHTLTFNQKTYDDYVNLLKGGMQAEADMKDNMNWRANLSSFLPFMSPAGINSAVDAHQKFKYTRRYYK